VTCQWLPGNAVRNFFAMREWQPEWRIQKRASLGEHMPGRLRTELAVPPGTLRGEMLWQMALGGHMS